MDFIQKFRERYFLTRAVVGDIAGSRKSWVEKMIGAQFSSEDRCTFCIASGS